MGTIEIVEQSLREGQQSLWGLRMRAGMVTGAAPLGRDGARGAWMHGHNTVGMQNLNYLKAVEHGITTIHACGRPMANGPSLPSTEMMINNLRIAGHDVAIDESVLEPLAEHFERVAAQEGWPTGVPGEYDSSVYVHQLPGGAMGSLKAQLAEHGLSDQLPALLEEIPRVREDFGHPISATPFAQLLGIQSLLNVTTGERFSVVPDEVIMFALGHYGTPPGKFSDELLDRVHSSKRGQELTGWELEDPSLRELKTSYGDASMSDERSSRATSPTRRTSRRR